MNRKARAAFRMVWAAVLGAIPAVCTAGDIAVSPLDDLAGVIQNAGSGDTIRLSPGVYPVISPITLTGNKQIQLEGDIITSGPLPTDYVVRFGSGTCSGNTVRNGDFELGSSDWTVTGANPDDVITQNGNPAGGNWHAWLKPATAPVLPNDQQELRLASPVNFNDIPPVLVQKVNQTHPQPGSPSSLLYELRQPLSVPPIPPETETRVVLNNVDIAPSTPYLYLWIQRFDPHPADRIEIFLDDESSAPVGTIPDTQPWGPVGQLWIYGFDLSAYTGVHNIIIKATLAASAASIHPSLCLLAAAEMRDMLLPPTPLVLPVTPLDLASSSFVLDPVVQAWLAAGGVSELPQITEYLPDLGGNVFVLPLGGFGRPEYSMKVKVSQKNPDAMGSDYLDVGMRDNQGNFISFGIFPENDPLFDFTTSCIPVTVDFPPVGIDEFVLACRISQPGGPEPPVATQFVVDDLKLTPLHPDLQFRIGFNLLKNPSFESGPVEWALHTPEYGTSPVNVGDLLSVSPQDQCNGMQSLRFRYPSTFTPKLFAWIKIPQWNTGSGDSFVIEGDGSPVFSVNDTNYSVYATGSWEKIVVPLPDTDPLELRFIASTSTRTSTPSIVVVGAAEINTIDPGPEPVNLLPLILATEEPVPDLNVPHPSVQRSSTSLAYRGNEALLFGGIGFPSVHFTVSAPQRSGNGSDQILLVINNAPVWSAVESAFVFSAPCTPVELPPFDPGSSIVAQFTALLADSGEPTNNTTFIVDDFCITPVCALMETLDPTVNICEWSLTPELDNGDGWESWGPPGPLNESIVRNTADACSPDMAAVFTPLPASELKTVITLSQEFIDIPAVSPYLSFSLSTSGDVTDKLICSINGQPLTPVFSASDPSLAAGREVSLSIPPGLWGQNYATLEFKALVAPSVVPEPGFRIDNVAICQTTPEPIFILEDNAQLSVTGLTFENGSPALSLRDQSQLCMTRSLVLANIGPGIILNHDSTANLAACVISGNGGVSNHGTGNLMLFQSTFTDAAPTGEGPIQVVASILMSPPPDQANVILSYVPGGAYPSPDPDFPNLDSGAFTVSFSNASPWPGKLDNSVQNLNLRNVKKVSELPAWAQPVCVATGLDFEGDFRSSSDGLLAGADEIGGGTGGEQPRWVSCTVTPNPAGKNSSVSITVETLNINLSGGAVILVPEEPVAGVPGMVDNPAHIVVVPFSNITDTNRASVSISFSSPFQHRSDLNTPVCTDGLNQIYLRDSNGTVYGPGFNEDAIEPQVKTSWRFLVDTLPPELVILPGNGNAQAGSPRVSESTDNVLAPDGPGGWPPLTLTMPASYGIIDTVGSQATPDTKAKDRHVFLNAPAGQPLEVAIEARFIDPRPKNTLGQTFSLLTVSGFGNNGVDLPNVPINSYVDHAAGSARARLSTDSTGLATVYRTIPEAATGESVIVAWNCVFDEAEGLKLAAQPQVKDGAGNESKKPDYALKVWWLQNASAALTVGPQGVASRTPRFEWRMNRPFNFAAAEIFPCYPIVRYKLWAAVDSGVSATQTRWQSLGGWSPWLRGTIELDPSELDQLRQDPNLQGRMILICVTGGDEAGNIQPAGAADGTTLNSVADLEASGVSYRWWINGDSRTWTSIDTNAKLALIWREGNNVVRQFGAARRIPTPPADKPWQVDAYVELNAILPSRTANIDATAASSQVFIHWTLLRDGQPVKPDAVPFTATVAVDASGKVTFQLSEILRTLNQEAGLALADPAVLFNPGKRERRFTLTAVAEAFVLDPTGGTISIKDSTPVVIEFAIYPAKQYEGIRDERPTRIYQRQ